MLSELRVPLLHTPVIWCDNISTIALSAYPVIHAGTKHLELDLHFVREKVLDKSPSVGYVPSYDQVADVFTKSLSTIPFQMFRFKLTVISHPLLRLRGQVNAHKNTEAHTIETHTRSICQSKNLIEAHTSQAHLC